MARKSIFDLLKDGNTLLNDEGRLTRYFSREAVVRYGTRDLSLKDYVAAFCFSKWKGRGRCIDVADFLETICYEGLRIDARYNVDSFLTFLELVLNFWNIVNNELEKEKATVKAYCTFYNAGEFISECLAQYNHKAVYYPDEEQVIVIEDKSEVTAVAEIVEPQLAKGILRYNHRSLQGDLEAKKSILLSMGAELEPRRGDMNTKDKDNEDLIFFMLNNLNLRHNNVTEGDSRYKEELALMPEEELEGWYDELYQMMLLAFLQLDNMERIERVKDLKKRICSK